ncbi:MAG: UbiA family prenyltransferase [Cytophagales bacterium]|nr:UbiA family prenyltransferase [Cytophagales bacterium]
MKSLKDAIILLRFPFSFFLLPIFLFGTYLGSTPFSRDYFLAFFLLHFLVYPASNGYNSHEDKDEEAIGGIEKPPPPNRLLFFVCLFFDIIAGVLAFSISLTFGVLISLYILFSRAYSSRLIRLKKRAILSYFIIAFFQGVIILWLAYSVSGGELSFTNRPLILSSIFAFLLLGGSYPITQIYQHKSDAKDGIISLSARLGVSKTLLFSEIHVAAAIIALYLLLPLLHFGFFILFMLPVLVYMQWWKRACKKDHAAASFKNTMRMNILASICLNAAFLTLIILKHA